LVRPSTPLAVAAATLTERFLERTNNVAGAVAFAGRLSGRTQR
jgi:hypothetical protein